MVIDFISAVDGKVCLYNGSELVAASDTVEELATMILNLNLNLAGAYCSSSMDFASEYGFLNDTAAVDLLSRALDVAICVAAEEIL